MQLARIISHLAEIKHISLEKAMDLYYNSNLSGKIHQGLHGIQYLDYKVLVQILCETELEAALDAMPDAFDEVEWLPADLELLEELV